MKQSKIFNSSLVFTILYCGLMIISAKCWLTMARPESTATKIIHVVVAVFLLCSAGVRTLGAILTIRKRIKNRRAGILEEPINCNHGSTIADFVHGVRYAPVEYFACFTCEGEKLGESTLNDPTRTQLSPEVAQLARKFPGGILAHNHPGGKYIAFSPVDLRCMARMHESVSIVVTRDLLFVMEIPPDCQYDWRKVYRVAKAEYVGDDKEMASANSCLAVARQFGFKFYAILFRDFCEDLARQASPIVTTHLTLTPMQEEG